MSNSAMLTSVRRLRSLLANPQNQEQSDEQLLAAFADYRDEFAFATLVRRHGPMVLGVCRRVLDHVQDAEDAYQATFLVLARRAAALRSKSALSSFLHGTAFHLASKVKRAAGRRRKYEGRVPAHAPTSPSDELLWREVRALLDEEIARLPEIYRSIFVLCCLENVSQAEVGHRLGLKERTVSYRLTQARKRLAQRLSRRGVELTALLAATTLASALPSELRAKTVEMALAPAAAPASVAELFHGVTATMMSKAKVMLLAVTLLGGVGVYFLASPQREQEEPSLALRAGERTDDAPHSAKRETAKDVEIQGRVLDPDGKPVRGAKLVFTYGIRDKIPHKVWAVSASDGRFAFALPMKELDKGNWESKGWEDNFVVAAAPGYGFAATQLSKAGAANLTLRLVKDDVPIRGRIIDLQGKPVAGALVRISNNTLVIAKKGDLTGFLADLRANKGRRWEHLTWLYSPAFDLLFPPVVTGADGRFVMKGIGRERIGHLRIEGPTIATQEVQVMTHASVKIQMPENKDSPKGPMVTYYGADFELLAAPSRPVVGVVRDKDTGKPLAGVTVESEKIAHDLKNGFLRTTTDKDGRYRLDGFPKGDGNEMLARTTDHLAPPDSELSSQRPYISVVKKVDNPLGIGPVTVDFALKRGVWVKGRVTDKKTGKPLVASINYFCFSDNPNAKELAPGGAIENWRQSRGDGFFQMPVLPGRGLIAVRAHQDHFVMGIGAEKIKGPRDRKINDLFITNPHFCFARNFHAVVEVDPKGDEESIVCDLALESGRSLKGTVLGPDGKPLAGARIAGRKDMAYWDDNDGADFTVESLLPNKPRVLQFMHEGKKLAGMVVLRGDEKEPMKIRLQPCGTLTGRLVTLRREPLAGVRVSCRVELDWNGKLLDTDGLDVRTDKDGRFRIVGLIAGRKYHDLHVVKRSYLLEILDGEPKDLTLKVGETRDLGEVKVKPME